LLLISRIEARFDMVNYNQSAFDWRRISKINYNIPRILTAYYI